ncbi:replication initiation protein RepC [Novosphingobium sp. HII-3]|uniref:replication initiation protein RepC n=1 Tax=Novosphingobium sp. HII-3 TaxID=2075565 RepID=UPI000CDB4D2B|nr:replication initiation protein RepC [Novosphingobium sp. HII-3]
MSVAQSPADQKRRTPEGGLPLGDLLPEMQLAADSSWQITKLSTAADRARWAASVLLYLRSNAGEDSANEAKSVRDRILKASRYLASRGSVTHPISKALWVKLYELTKLCAYEPDWSSASGPLMGASNKTLEDRWNVTNARRSLRDLAQWGFIVPFCPKGNGHRSYKKTKQGPVGAGWSLAPLRLLVDALEAIVDREENLRLLRVDIPERITSAARATRALLNPFKDSEEWARSAWSTLNEICKRRDNAKKGALATLQDCLDEAITLLSYVENTLIKCSADSGSGMKASTTPDAWVHHQYNDSIRESDGNGLAQGDSGQGSVLTSALRKVHVSPEVFQDIQASDPFGVTRSGFVWSEAPHLFPFHTGLIDLKRGPIRGTVDVLARIIGVSTVTACLAERRLGREAATICLLMTGQHSSDGLIKKTPEAYLRGLIRKAVAGELNIGHTLFGRRGNSEPTPVTSH